MLSQLDYIYVTVYNELYVNNGQFAEFNLPVKTLYHLRSFQEHLGNGYCSVTARP